MPLSVLYCIRNVCVLTHTLWVWRNSSL